jgi:hypothetical protein
VAIAQLVRASVCGTEGRGFESHWPPRKKIVVTGDLFSFRGFCDIAQASVCRLVIKKN